jgi:UDP-N-acetylglucosamine--N-acetylmuramyl-(pentapeptide) pyrophosphoryl-undecaprenol N-acetylglucosamine transferase
VPPRGYRTAWIRAKAARGKGLLQKLLLPANLLFSFWESARLIRRLKPDVVLGLGGYVAFPGGMMASLLNRPLALHEQNAIPGLANRVLSTVSDKVMVAFPDTLKPAEWTGNPVRSEIAATRRAPDAGVPVVAVFGGSLGSVRINDAALALYDRWRDRADIAVHHVTGPRNYEECMARLTALRRPGDALRYELVAYEEHMEQLYARTTVAVCRAGAVTVAELAAAGVPAVLVPLPGAPGDHQTRNAEALAAADAAVVLPDHECDGDRLEAEVTALLADPARLESMSEAARGLARPDAAARLADLVEEVARSGG